jgi:hypothetical protein
MSMTAMKTVSVGGRTYRLVAVRADDGWVARAERTGTGERFGIECSAPTEAEAESRLANWLTWQHEHAAALAALQQAERAYHQTILGSAFANPTEGPSAIELQKESLEAVEQARLRLDEIRSRKPEC